MSDEGLRELERRFRESGSADDEAAWLRERARSGEMLDWKHYSRLHELDVDSAMAFLESLRLPRTDLDLLQQDSRTRVGSFLASTPARRGFVGLELARPGVAVISSAPECRGELSDLARRALEALADFCLSPTGVAEVRCTALGGRLRRRAGKIRAELLQDLWACCWGVGLCCLLPMDNPGQSLAEVEAFFEQWALADTSSARGAGLARAWEATVLRR